MSSHNHGTDHSHDNHNSKNSNSSKTDKGTTVKQQQQQNQVIQRLYVASSLCAVFLIVEVVGGWIAGSLAVLSDAAHLFSDLASFAVAIAAAHLAALPSTEQHTFGLKRMESLAALFSMVCLALVSVGLASEAVVRLLSPPDEGVDGKLMSGIAGMGVVVNIILAFVLGEHHVHMPGGEEPHDHDHDHHDDHDSHDHDSHDHHDHHDDHGSHDSHDHHDHHDTDEEEGCHGHDTHDNHSHGHNHVDETVALVTDHHNEQTNAPVGYGSIHPIHANEVVPTKKARNINLEAAYIHVLGDLAQSVAVLIAGVIIWLKPEWHIVDPICTLLFCAMVFYSTLGVLRSSISVLLEEVPPNVNWKDTYDTISQIDGVTNVHDLHIWSISHGVPTLSVHCMATDPEQALKCIYFALKEKGITHATIQVQLPNLNCTTCVEGCDATRISGILDANKLQDVAEQARKL